MTDILLRDLPDQVIATIDDNAKRLGLSRNEYLRRHLAATVPGRPKVTVEDLRRFCELVADLDDPDVMGQAWS